MDMSDGRSGMYDSNKVASESKDIPFHPVVVPIPGNSLSKLSIPFLPPRDNSVEQSALGHGWRFFCGSSWATRTKESNLD